jgi:hypothetical protein
MDDREREMLQTLVFYWIDYMREAHIHRTKGDFNGFMNWLHDKLTPEGER